MSMFTIISMEEARRALRNLREGFWDEYDLAGIMEYGYREWEAARIAADEAEAVDQLHGGR